MLNGCQRYSSVSLVYALLLVLIVSSRAYSRDVKLYAICYGLSKITVFEDSDRKIEITDRQAMIRILAHYTDMLIDGRLTGNDYGAAHAVPSVFYLNGLYAIPYVCKHPSHHNYQLCTTFAAHPEWKLTANGTPLFRWAYECFEVMNVGHPAFQKFMGSHVKDVLARRPFFQGVFVDDVSGHFNHELFGFHKTDEQAIVQQAAEGIPFVTVKHTINQSQGHCSSVEVRKSDGTLVHIHGIWHSAKTIFLKPEVLPGEQVMITYFSNAPDWQMPNDEQWTDATAGLLACIKESIGNRLLIYNGTQLGHIYDTKFLQYADGCMREGFVEGQQKLQHWKADIDRLATISRSKMYFTLTYLKKNASLEEELRQLNFSFASFLLGNNGKGYFAVSYSGQHALFHEQWGRTIGKPRADYRAQENGVFVREYELAFVAVNPGEKAAAVSLPPGFTATPKAGFHSGRLDPKTGVVLYRNANLK